MTLMFGDDPAGPLEPAVSDASSGPELLVGDEL